MDNPYDAHSWSKLYREERLAEARERRFAGRADRPSGRRFLRRTNVASLMASIVIVAVFLASVGCVSTDGPGTLGDRPRVLDGISLEARRF